MSSIQDHRIAVVGAGYWGKNLVRNFEAIGVLGSICDRREEILDQFAAQYPAIPRSPSFEEILVSTTISAVAIASPAETHYEMAKESLLAGKDVFIEKPLALHEQEGIELHEMALDRKRILMVGHLLQYHPAIVRLKHLISDGELGKIQYIYSNRLNLGKIRREENILWSFAPHDISVILSLTDEMPDRVVSTGANYLHQNVADVTISSLAFSSGINAHVFVSWLHPYKEQRLIVVGDRKMALFNDVEPEDKLLLYPHKIEWKNHLPVPDKREAERVPVENKEPLREECLHFVDCIVKRMRPKTDAEEAIRVLSVLEACQESLSKSGVPVSLAKKPAVSPGKAGMIHDTAVIDPDCKIGAGTKIWHFSHVIQGSEIGSDCSIGQNVVIGPHVKIGNGVKIQNNVSVYQGVELEDGVFCGPSMVFTNVYNPRSYISRRNEIRPTLVREGATLGANCTIVCGHTIGRFSFIAAGAVVLEDVPDFALFAGNPAEYKGLVCKCGLRLHFEDKKAVCENCGLKYEKKGQTVRESQAQ
jgi:UDP-2-acetamido-3-amino-2,3-dideoxy-glucuronate N-acetyltransferase